VAKIDVELTPMTIEILDKIIEKENAFDKDTGEKWNRSNFIEFLILDHALDGLESD